MKYTLILILMCSCSARITLTDREKQRIKKSYGMGYWCFKPEKVDAKKLVNYGLTGALAGYSLGQQKNIKWP